MSPCCAAPLIPEPYAYRDYETGYHDEGCRYRCSRCGAEVDEGDVVVAEEEMEESTV